MSEFVSVDRINTLKSGIESKTGETYTDLTAGVQALADGYGQGGGGIDRPTLFNFITFIDENTYTITDDRYVDGMALRFMEEFCNSAPNNLIYYECEITNNTAQTSAANYHYQFGDANHTGANGYGPFVINIRDNTNIWNTWDGKYYDPAGNVILASTRPANRGFRLSAGSRVTVRRYSVLWS